MGDSPDAYTNYTAIRPQCLNPHHLFSDEGVVERPCTALNRNSMQSSTAGTYLEVRLPIRGVLQLRRGPLARITR